MRRLAGSRKSLSAPYHRQHRLARVAEDVAFDELFALFGAHNVAILIEELHHLTLRDQVHQTICPHARRHSRMHREQEGEPTGVQRRHPLAYGDGQ
jgi:hypothetical protein